MKTIVFVVIASVAMAPFAHAQYTFGSSVVLQGNPSPGITYNSGAGTFQYADAASSSTDSNDVPLTGTAATFITTSNGWTASINVSLSAKTMVATNTEAPHNGIWLAVGSSNFANAAYIGLNQNNFTGTTVTDGADDAYGTATQFGAETNGSDASTTPLGTSLTGSTGDSYQPLSGGTSSTPTTESVNAATGVLTLRYNAATNIVTGYYNGAPVGSFSLAGWGSSSSLTLVVFGNSGGGLNVPAGADTASNFSASVISSPFGQGYSVGKEEQVTQTSNSAPANAQYFFGAICPQAGSVSGPGGTYNLSYDQGPNEYRYTSSTFSSLANLNSAFPDGTYGLNSGFSVNLSGDVYPTAPKITLVNGVTPVWNAQGQLALDPTVTNTLTWTSFSATNGSWNFNTGGFEERFLAGNQDTVSSDGVAWGSWFPGGQSAFTTYTIPANTLNLSNTYALSIDYELLCNLSNPQTNIYNFAGYDTETAITIAAQKAATVTLGSLVTTYNGMTRSATATTSPAGLNVTFTYNGSSTAPSAAGSYTVVGTINNTSYQGSATGTLVISATQSFSQWETFYGLTSGPTDTPENDNVPNLLKYLADIDPLTFMTPNDRAALPTVGMTTISGTEYITLTYRQFAAITGVTVNFQTSPDLQVWTTVKSPTTIQTGTDGNTGDPIMQFQIPFTGSKEFVRLNVILP